MKLLLLPALAALLWVQPLHAQKPLPADELRLDARLSASNGVAYPGPLQPRLTPAPRGTKPFYLSHYGRHGSRYMTKAQDYDYLVSVLDRAEREQKLSPLGQDVLQRVRQASAEGRQRLGELSPLGRQQHKDIARRMVERFPEVFQGSAHIDARSTLVPRCILSMSSALQQLLVMNPRLQVSEDAAYSDTYYMNLNDRRLVAQASSAPTRQAYDDYCRQHQRWQRVVGSLFCDTAYVSALIEGERLNYYLFRMAGSLQNTEQAETLSLYDVFTEDEILENWRMENVFWYLGYGHCPLNGGEQPFTQRNLLRRIIEQADSCIALDRPGATLRFGHETMVLPLVCLMGLDGYDASTACMDSLEALGWANYRIYPMACNVQMVFYRKNPRDKNVLVKVLLNENEAALPLPTSQPPYYWWDDVRSYFLKKLDAYKEQ